MVEFVNIIQTVGFPIAATGACGFFIFKLWEQSKDREQNYIDIIQEQNKRFDAQDLQLQAIVLTQEKIIERLEKMEQKGEQ